MRIPFQIGGVPAEYVRSRATGRAKVLVGDEEYSVQSPFQFSTHITFQKRHVWRCDVQGHDVEIVKVKRGGPSATVTIRVDDEVVGDGTE